MVEADQDASDGRTPPHLHERHDDVPNAANENDGDDDEPTNRSVRRSVHETWEKNAQERGTNHLERRRYEHERKDNGHEKDRRRSRNAQTRAWKRRSQNQWTRNGKKHGFRWISKREQTCSPSKDPGQWSEAHGNERGFRCCYCTQTRARRQGERRRTEQSQSETTKCEHHVGQVFHRHLKRAQSPGRTHGAYPRERTRATGRRIRPGVRRNRNA
mmetsp:Transcript_50/g.445  ORF Transcript_50/g.445 Transcript_50/m.445 type:complete len:215 (+) Transcript_50:315-959(+)